MVSLILDPFTYSNGALSTVGSSVWSTLTGESSLNVTSNVLIPTAFNADNANYVNSTALASIAADQWAQIVIAATCGNPGAGGEGIGVLLRGDTASRTGYRCLAGTTAVSIARMRSGTYTLLNTQTGLTIAVSDVIYAEIQGYTIVLKQNGTTRCTFDDSPNAGTRISAGRFGVQHSSDTAGTNPSRLDNFEGGDFSAGGGGGAVQNYLTLLGAGA